MLARLRSSKYCSAVTTSQWSKVEGYGITLRIWSVYLKTSKTKTRKKTYQLFRKTLRLTFPNHEDNKLSWPENSGVWRSVGTRRNKVWREKQVAQHQVHITIRLDYSKIPQHQNLPGKLIFDIANARDKMWLGSIICFSNLAQRKQAALCAGEHRGLRTGLLVCFNTMCYLRSYQGA